MTAAVYKAQYKAKNAYESWTNIGTYSSESEALNVAMKKKNSGALMVRVVMALAGHGQIATTQRYIDLRPSVVRAAVELVS